MAQTARRRQSDRTAETRGALLRATVDTLAERGFAGTSTTEIARRAGVSRGAQVHHFPTKLDLVTTALDHVFADREAAFRRRFEGLADADRTQATAVRVFIEISDTPHQLALLELLNAARTDDDLRPVARRVLRRFEQAVTAIFTEILPDATDAGASTRVLVAMAILQSASLHRELGLGDEAGDLQSALEALSEALPLTDAPAPDTTGTP